MQSGCNRQVNAKMRDIRVIVSVPVSESVSRPIMIEYKLRVIRSNGDTRMQGFNCDEV